jgi:hypothetical protein
LAATAAASRPKKIPSTIRPRSARVLVEVKTFWIHLPTLSPRVLRSVRKTISRIATSCCTESDTA